ncbi:SPOR domain-containing protein, partial [bacterium]|nr:SPOR domain-containing protein [bacterium]
DPPSHNIDNGNIQDPQRDEPPIGEIDTGPGDEDVIYRIQVGTFSERENAENVWESLIQADYDASISTYTDSDRVMYRVQVGMYQDRLEADRDAEELRRMNFDAWVYQLS